MQAIIQRQPILCRAMLCGLLVLLALGCSRNGAARQMKFEFKHLSDNQAESGVIARLRNIGFADAGYTNQFGRGSTFVHVGPVSDHIVNLRWTVDGMSQVEIDTELAKVQADINKIVAELQQIDAAAAK